jgi:hypothetical protein
MVMANETIPNITPPGDTNPVADTINPSNTAPDKPAITAPPVDTAAKPLTQADIDRAVKAALKDSAQKIADAEAKAKLSEEDRTKAQIAELQVQIKTRDARDAVSNEAVKLGVKNPALVYKLVKDELEFGADGKISNLADIFDSAKADYPELFDNKPSSSIDAGAGTSGNKTGLTKEQLEKMTPTEINALDWSVVSKVLSEG